MTDPFGQAIQDFFRKGKAPDIQVDSNYTEGESIPVSYFFRDEKQMPELEKLAIKKCKGRVLDVGAAAGCHSLILQKKGFNVTALEISQLAADVIKKRGVLKVVQENIFDYKDHKYDTILVLMNGSGIGGTMQGLEKLLIHLKSLLHEDGQILIDSSDIKYLFEEDDGSIWVDMASDKYYGEMTYDVSYKKHQSSFQWLFVDPMKLSIVANKAGLSSTILTKGDHFDYLAQLKVG